MKENKDILSPGDWSALKEWLRKFSKQKGSNTRRYVRTSRKKKYG